MKSGVHDVRVIWPEKKVASVASGKRVAAALCTAVAAVVFVVVEAESVLLETLSCNFASTPRLSVLLLDIRLIEPDLLFAFFRFYLEGFISDL